MHREWNSKRQLRHWTSGNAVRWWKEKQPKVGGGFCQRYKKGDFFPLLLLLLLCSLAGWLFFGIRCSQYFIYFSATNCGMRSFSRAHTEWAKSNNSLVWAVGNLCSPIYINLLPNTGTHQRRIHLSCSYSTLQIQLQLRNTHGIIKNIYLMVRYASNQPCKMSSKKKHNDNRANKRECFRCCFLWPFFSRKSIFSW